MITKDDLRKKIRLLLKKKSYQFKDYELFELYIQLYLILDKRRKLAQIGGRQDKKILKKQLHFLDNNYPYYVIRKDKRNNTIILYDKNYPIEQLNETYSKKFAKDLGNFYVCAGSLNKIFKKDYLLRPSIEVIYKNKNGKEMDMEIFGQMCFPSKCIRNLKKFYMIRNQFQKYLSKIDKRLRVHFTMNVFSYKF